MNGNSPPITASTSNFSSWKLVTKALSSSSLSWSFNFSPRIGSSFSRRTKSVSSTAPSTRVLSCCWANNHEWVHLLLWLLLIPWGRPKSSASPSFQCERQRGPFSLSFCQEEPQMCPESLGSCYHSSNDCECVGGRLPGDRKIKHMSGFSRDPEVTAGQVPQENKGCPEG